LKKAMVDTEIWAISKKKPDERKLTSREKFIKALKMHQKAKLFFRNTFPKLKVYMSLHQLAEIYHVLAFRGIKIPREDVESIIEAILEDDNIIKVAVTLEHLEEAIKESARSNIHIWDYLCFLPVKDYVDTVFSCDEHFIKIGEEYGVEVINPLDIWITL